jgi:hypothetical protein
LEARQQVAEQQRLAADEERQADENRVALASRLENGFLDSSMDVTVTATGQDHTTLRVAWVGVSRVTAYKMSKESVIFQSARAAGFKRIEISDGYGSEWYWKLD